MFTLPLINLIQIQVPEIDLRKTTPVFSTNIISYDKSLISIK